MNDQVIDRGGRLQGEWWICFHAPCSVALIEPSSCTQASSGVQSARWFQAMQSEITSSLEIKIWSLVPMSDSMHVLTEEWIYKSEHIAINSGRNNHLTKPD